MQRIVRRAALAALLLALVSVSRAAELAKKHAAIEPVPRSGPGWKARHAAMNARVKQGNVDLVMIGDSITQGWEGPGKNVFNEFYGGRNAANLGIGGDRTQHVLWRLQNGNLDGIAPKLAVLMIGTNNSGDDTPEEIADGVAHIVALLREKLPEMKILVLAIFPRGPDGADPRRQVNQKTNALIAKLADGRQVEYLDIGPRFLRGDGTLSRDVMPDLLHLSPGAYRTWAEAIEPVVSKVLEPKDVKKPAEPADDEAGFVPLFDGETLAGWRKAGRDGGATYAAEDGAIVGRVGPGRNTFLRTKKEYGDFILKLDVKLDVPGNSGIQIRSHENDKGLVYGYQCEIDPSERAWSGGIYDEGRRAWLYPLDGDAKARAAFKLDGWNRFTIRAVGPSIQTWINGVPCADLVDVEDLSGFIALQVHAGKQGQIRWRNIRIKDLGASAWKPLFDGKSLAGWRRIGTGEWTVRDGEILGAKAAADKEFGHLISDRPYTDFAVRLKYKATTGNSGLYFRVEEGGDAGVLGFQAEIDPRENAGGLYETRGRGWVVHPPVALVKKAYKPNEWNRMSVVALGRRLVVHLNGVKTAELADDPGRERGFLALQLHGGQDMDVRFKDIEILDMSAAASP
ncbi:MAG: DUF1080 domain-containing protein [Pirellulales bacterium]|nr:DUF1080 domain-containing protein [Pirellulales bacterium]